MRYGQLVLHKSVSRIYADFLDKQSDVLKLKDIETVLYINWGYVFLWLDRQPIKRRACLL